MANSNESRYKRLKEFFLRRHTAYQRVFDTQNVYLDAVLSDLAKFCRANESTFHSDPRVHALLEGRREVFLRILKHLSLEPSKLQELYEAGKVIEDV